MILLLCAPFLLASAWFTFDFVRQAGAGKEGASGLGLGLVLALIVCVILFPGRSAWMWLGLPVVALLIGGVVGFYWPIGDAVEDEKG